MTNGPVLQGLRVVDRTTGIAGPYCTKLLADAGADVVKVERDGADPLRAHGTGALFEFLNASKRAVTDDSALVASAHMMICNEPPTDDELVGARPDLVMVTITPFGRNGPWVGRPWTEFTLQAACGSTGNRGLPERPPLAAGGRIGEWVAGTYAGLAALAALREARRSGRGEDVDVAVFDSMALTMTTYPSVFASFFGWPPLAGTGRSIQLPSVEPTSDGCAVFTANSAQQFQDFLVFMERPDLLEDRDLAMVGKRFARRDEFIEAVRAFTSTKTTAELLDKAAAFRIPAAPVLDARGVLAFEHFASRDVFVPSPSGRFTQPRVPYRIEGFAARPFAPAPARGADDGAVGWDDPGAPGTAPDDAWQLPLCGVKVVDMTAWWAGPAATNILAALGADVVKVESVSRPDQMRLSSTRHPPADAWWEWGPIFHAANLSKRGVTLDLNTAEGLALLHRLIDEADVLVENFTPRVVDNFGLDFDSLRRRNPRLVMVRMPSFGLDGPWRDRTGFAQTMEAVSGLAWRTGYEDELPTLVLGACDPIAGAHAVIATLLALDARDRHGVGLLVESVMVESALNVAAEGIVEYGAGAPPPGRMGNRGPDAAPQGVYPGASPDSWVALAVENDAQWDALVTVLGSPSWAADSTLRTADGRRAHHDMLDKHLGAWTSERTAEEAVASLSAAGVPAEVVIAARDVLHNPQLQDRGLFETEDHPVTGPHPVPTLPFRFAHVDAWLRAPSPTLGQHNDEVLAGLGVDADERETLRAHHVIGEKLVGT